MVKECVYATKLRNVTICAKELKLLFTLYHHTFATVLRGLGFQKRVNTNGKNVERMWEKMSCKLVKYCSLKDVKPEGE